MDRTIEIIKSFGLLNYEAEVYAALVKFERAKVQDLVGMVPVPRPQIYLTLKKLVNKGMCIENKGKISHYTAVSPGIAFKNILESEKKMLDAKANWLKKVDDEIYQRKKKKEVPYEFIQVLKGNQIRESLKKIIGESEKEILVFFQFPLERNEKEMEDAVKLEVSVLKKGVKVRCLYQEGFLNPQETDWILPYLKKVLGQGEQGRVVNSLPLNMLIVDDRAATFSLSHRGKDDVTVFLFNHPTLISVMKAGFEYFWAKGIDIKKVLPKKGVKNDTFNHRNNSVYRNRAVASPAES